MIFTLTSSCYRIIDYSEKMLQSKRKTFNQKNRRSSEVTTTEDVGDNFARLTFAVGSSTMNKQQTRQEEMQEDQEFESEVDDWVENTVFDNSDKNY